MSAGDGQAGHPPELSDGDETRGRMIETVMLFAHLLDSPRHNIRTFRQNPTLGSLGEEDGEPLITFNDETVVAKAEGETTLSVTVHGGTVDEARFRLQESILNGIEAVTVTVFEFCDDCEEVHFQDLAAFVRVPSTAYFMASWVE